MKLSDYEMLEAMRARDWRAAAQCLARHFNIVDLLPPPDSFKVHEETRVDVAMTFYIHYRRKGWYWDEASGFFVEEMPTYSHAAKLWAEYCDET